MLLSYFAFALRILSVSCLAMWPNIWGSLCKPITKYKILDMRPWHLDTKLQNDTKSELQISLPSDIDVGSVSQNKPGGGIWGKQNSFPPNWWISSLPPQIGEYLVYHMKVARILCEWKLQMQCQTSCQNIFVEGCSAMFVFLPSVGKKVKFETDVFIRSGPSDGSVLKRYRPTVQQRKR